MTKNLNKMPTPSGIGAGQTANVKLPIGMTYDLILIDAMVDVSGTSTPVPAGAWGTYFDEIRLIANGTTIQQMDAADLVKMNAYHGQTFPAGIQGLFQIRPWLSLNENQDVTALGTGGISTLTLEIDIKSGVQVDSLVITAERSPQRNFGPHRRIQKHAHTQGLTGEAEIYDLQKGPYLLQALHINTAGIEALKVRVNGRDILETTKRLRAAKNAIEGKVTQTGFTHMNMNHYNRYSEAMSMNVQDFRLIGNFTATGNFTILSEVVRGAL
jgi:hypothetical protein